MQFLNAGVGSGAHSTSNQATSKSVPVHQSQQQTFNADTELGTFVCGAAGSSLTVEWSLATMIDSILMQSTDKKITFFMCLFKHFSKAHSDHFTKFRWRQTQVVD